LQIIFDSIFNTYHDAPILCATTTDEDKNERGKTNEAKITSKSSYQIGVAVSESNANVNVSQPPAIL